MDMKPSHWYDSSAWVLLAAYVLVGLYFLFWMLSHY